jgi:hypothetical protein
MSIEKPNKLNNAEPVEPTAETEGETADTEAMLQRVQERVNTESGELTEEEAGELAKVLRSLDLLAENKFVSTPKEVIEAQVKQKSDPVIGGSNQIDADQPKHEVVDHSLKKAA